jgi:coenzyme F420-0:L-glutamate ligase / coenzyme F420-1:gamma-L-glutamate ligase
LAHPIAFAVSNAIVTPRPIHILPLAGIPEIHAGDDLASLIARVVESTRVAVTAGDVFVIAQKVVSKAEGRVVRLDSVEPSGPAITWARENKKDPRVVELVFRESRSILKMERGIIVAETHHGFMCANAGVDLSNVAPGAAVLLPEDPDRSARKLSTSLSERFSVHTPVIISDTFGRPLRNGLVNVALGVAGLAPLLDYRGTPDATGRHLQATVIASADEIASAAELVMGKSNNIPVVIVKGIAPSKSAGSGADLIRDKSEDLFR